MGGETDMVREGVYIHFGFEILELGWPTVMRVMGVSKLRLVTAPAYLSLALFLFSIFRLVMNALSSLSLLDFQLSFSLRFSDWR